jgi:hypothetical protein
VTVVATVKASPLRKIVWVLGYIFDTKVVKEKENIKKMPTSPFGYQPSNSSYIFPIQSTFAA